MKFKLSTTPSIIYIACCAIVLMKHNGRYMVSAPTTNFKLSTDLNWRINYIQCVCAVKFIAMKYSKEEIEKRLKDMLHEMLRGYHQEDSILSLEYDEEKQECNLKMNVHIVEDDDYVGFGVY